MLGMIRTKTHETQALQKDFKVLDDLKKKAVDEERILLEQREAIRRERGHMVV